MEPSLRYRPETSDTRYQVGPTTPSYDPGCTGKAGRQVWTSHYILSKASGAPNLVRGPGTWWLAGYPHFRLWSPDKVYKERL